jgi:lipoprotein-anchoring transpeptidase ErfK/SrfK
MLVLSRTALVILLVALGCERKDPPGAEGRRADASVVRAVGSAPTEPESPTARPPGSVEPGGAADSLPFSPDGSKIASIAWRNWIYTDTGPNRTRHGYLRAGAIVDTRGPAIKNEGCPGGWYRVNPRGFVCVGKGATLDQNHPVVKAMSVPPKRGEGLPYIYAMASEEPPFLYFRLPSMDEMEHLEGGGLKNRSLNWRGRETARGTIGLLGTVEGPPSFLSPTAPLEKPYGVKQNLHYAVHAGRSAPDAGFALERVFEWEGRVFGLTTELDVIALDRTRLVKPSVFHGVELGEGEDLPVAMVENGSVSTVRPGSSSSEKAGSLYQRREWIKFTGQRCPVAPSLHETRDGGCVAQVGLRVIKPRENFPSFATGSRKWVDISILQQSLVAYVGRKAEYVTLVSTGRGMLGDPEKTFASPQGTFMIHDKHVAVTMDGSEDKADSYALLDVPFVQYFHKGYALHGTYWHDEYGRVRSHGCINLAPIDAAWMFEWTDPPVPQHWHHVINRERGTVVSIHP